MNNTITVWTVVSYWNPPDVPGGPPVVFEDTFDSEEEAKRAAERDVSEILLNSDIKGCPLVWGDLGGQCEEIETNYFVYPVNVRV